MVTPMVVLVCGGRDFDDLARMYRVLDGLGPKVVRIVHGGCSGADRMAEVWAADRGVPWKEYPALWSEHGKAAGPIRNSQMLRLEKPDLVVIFPGGRGTADMERKAAAARLPILYG